MIDPCEILAADDQAKIGDAVLDQLEAGIAAGKDEQLHASVELSRLGSVEAAMQLEGNEIVLPARRPPPAPQIVLSGCQECVRRHHLVAVLELGGPSVRAWIERAGAAPAADFRAGRRRDAEDHLIQRAARDAEGRKRQAGGRHLVAGVKPDR